MGNATGGDADGDGDGDGDGSAQAVATTTTAGEIVENFRVGQKVCFSTSRETSFYFSFSEMCVKVVSVKGTPQYDPKIDPGVAVLLLTHDHAHVGLPDVLFFPHDMLIPL